ncbi:MAG: hypothetical protein LH702_31820 [Phormidesmis sp. CAN_BIN44]|nr:hypothetical protein [Phormidesmis sp. CAN_BIN44]
MSLSLWLTDTTGRITLYLIHVPKQTFDKLEFSARRNLAAEIQELRDRESLQRSQAS